jgi:ribokinase
MGLPVVGKAHEARRGDASSYYRIGAERVAAVDSTGAGDAFSGSLVAAMLRFAGQPFRTAVEHANRCAAMSTETVGTAPAMPRFADVIARFAHS